MVLCNGKYFFFEEYDTVKMQTFDFGSPHILAQQHHLVVWSRHKNFEDQMLLSLDMKIFFKSVHFNVSCFTLSDIED
jgi:hypothetical protein